MDRLVLVMAGGAFGAGARFLLARAVGASRFPWGTLGVNVIGGLLMGLLAAALTRGQAGEPQRLLLGVGVLGGFTTFSAFSLDTVNLIEGGQALAALSYVLASVLGALAALYAGLMIGRAL